MILVQTDMQTLLISAQTVCHKWHDLIQNSADLQAALFLKPIRYTLPNETPGICNPLLAQYIWPWLSATKTQEWGAPPVEGGAKTPDVNSREYLTRYNDRFLLKFSFYRINERSKWTSLHLEWDKEGSEDWKILRILLRFMSETSVRSPLSRQKSRLARRQFSSSAGNDEVMEESYCCHFF